MIDGVLLDIDGTLLLSNEAHARAWSDAYRQFGHDIPWQRIQPLIGMGGDKLEDTLVPGMSSEHGVGKQITDRRKEIFLTQYLPDLRPAPGARALLTHLKDEGLKLTIATSAKSDELQALLRAARVEDVVGETTTSDDANESKPSPDIVEAALEKSGLRADRVVMIGDTPYDVESAGRAEVGLIAVRCGGHDDEDLRGALAVYDDPADILAHIDETPLAREAERSRR